MAAEGAQTIGQRFTLLEHVADGAFGAVYRARDETTGALVALKRAHTCLDAPGRERFAREAQLLEKIDSPHVVGHVAHGVEAERPWLALEWLEGADLRRRQAARRLSLPAAVEIVRQAAVGLDALHQAGIVHRDLKPSNFLIVEHGEDGMLVKLIDLGVAHVDADVVLTSEGLRIGTPAYMSPEQAAGAEHVGPKSDVFSLGVVLFELVSGRRPYAGADAVALLARIVLDEAPRLSTVIAGVPRELDDVVACALSKDPAKRFATALDMAGALAALEVPDVLTPPAQGEPATTATAPASPASMRERRVVTTLFARAPATAAGSRALEQLHALAASHGGDSYRLLGRRLVSVFGGVRSSGDEVLRAARIALAAKADHPALVVAIATGHAVTGGVAVSGQVIDRGSAELDRAGENICIDALTARMLDDHFVVAQQGDVRTLLRERSLSTQSERRLLGHALPLLERERELGQLEDLLERAIDERSARAAVVRGPAGIGKTRLRAELSARLQGLAPDVQTLVLRGDPMLAEVPYGMLTHGLRRHTGRETGAEPRMLAHRSREPAVLVAELLRLAGEDDRDLAEVGGDPSVLAARLREAATAFVAKLCEPAGLLLVLEDAQWADPSSIDVLGWVLDALADRPLCLLALARPEIDERFAELWSHAFPLSIEMRPLSLRGARTLVRSVMSGDASEALVRTIAERSGGNPLFAEELIRAALRSEKATEPDELPLAIQAAFQVRLDALPPLAKSVVLRGSVLGRALWDRALEAIVPRADVARAIDALIGAEVLAERPRSRFAGTRELVFRHSLLYDAAYALLPEEERRRAHAAAARWLAAAGEEDDAVLALHFDRALEREEAGRRYLGAAEHALRKAAPAVALAHAERALACTKDVATQARLHAAAARACHLLGRYDAGLAHSEQGLAIGSDLATRIELAAVRCLTLRRAGEVERALACISDALAEAASARDRAATPGPLWRAWIEARLELGWTQYNAGAPEEALASARAVRHDVPAGAPEWLGLELNAGHLEARAELALGELVAARDSHAAVVAESERHGHGWRGAGARQGLGEALLALGDAAGARRELERSRDHARELRLPSAAGYACALLGLLELRFGELEAAERSAREALAAATRIGARPMQGAAEAVLARVALARGEHEAAQAHAYRAAELAAGAWALLARAVLSAAGHRAVERAREVSASLAQGRDVLEAHDQAAALALAVLEREGDERAAAALRARLAAEREARLARIADAALSERAGRAFAWA